MATARTLERMSGRELRSWLLGLTALCFMPLVLSGCNTARGAGEDVSAAGDVITEPFEDDDEDSEQGG
jgi:predicted small secreted protein